MMHEQGDEESRLTRLLRSVRADADPALWTRVRARIESRPRLPGLLDWAMRPAALAASLTLLIVSAALALTLAAGTTVSSGEEYATLADALLAERDTEPADAAGEPRPTGGTSADSGGAL